MRVGSRLERMNFFWVRLHYLRSRLKELLVLGWIGHAGFPGVGGDPKSFLPSGPRNRADRALRCPWPCRGCNR